MFNILDDSILIDRNLQSNAITIPWNITLLLDQVKQLEESQTQERNLDESSIFNLRRALVYLEQKSLYYQGILTDLVAREKEAVISEDGIQQMQLGDVTAIYQCNKITEFTPIFTRKINDECFNDIPIILPNTQNLPLTQCVWAKYINLFLSQFMTYTYNKSADIMTK